MDDWDDFEKEADANWKKLQKIKKDRKTKPLDFAQTDLSFGGNLVADAVALCIIRRTCERCHTVFEFPNQHLLLRFKNNWKWSRHKDGFAAYRHLHHEVKLINDTVYACLSCFTSDKYLPPVSKLTEEQLTNLENGEPAS